MNAENSNVRIFLYFTFDITCYEIVFVVYWFYSKKSKIVLVFCNLLQIKAYEHFCFLRYKRKIGGSYEKDQIFSR